MGGHILNLESKKNKLAPLFYTLALMITAFSPPSAEARRHPKDPSLEEECQDGTPYSAQKPPSPAVTFDSGIDARFNPSLLTDAAKAVQSGIFKTIFILSGYRDCSRNSGTPGSSKTSKHLHGEAIDIPSITPRSDAKKLASVHNGRLLWNTCVQHVHMDTSVGPGYDECGGAGSFKRQRVAIRNRRK